MPHIHLLTSANLVENVDLPDILRRLVAELSVQDSVESSAVKAYHSLFHTWAMGEGAPAGFAHCRVYLLTGRTPELRGRIAEAMFAQMRQVFQDSLAHGEVGVTVEIREMDRETYRKGS